MSQPGLSGNTCSLGVRDAAISFGGNVRYWPGNLHEKTQCVCLKKSSRHVGHFSPGILVLFSDMHIISFCH